MSLLDIASIGELQVRGHADLNLGQDIEQQGAPPLARPLLHAAPQPIRGRDPPLRGPKHEVDGCRRGDSVAVIEHRLLDP